MRFSRWATAVAALVLAVGVLTPLGSTGVAQTNRKIDRNATIRYLGPVPPARFDPLRSTNAGDDHYMYFIYDRLTQVANDGSIQPMLAESWSFSKDGSALEMKLRKGVKFQDGTPFDAAAVKANIDRYKAADTSTAAAKLSSVTSVDVVDDNTVRFNLAPGKGAELPANLTTNAGMMVSPAALTREDLVTNPGNAGSGAFVLKDLKVNESATFERRPDKYWDSKNAGLAKEVQVSFLPVGIDRVKAVQAGNADVAYANGAGTSVAYQTSRGNKSYQTVPGEAVSLYSIMLRPERGGAVENLKFRQALSAALDRSAIITALGEGVCRPGSQPYAKGSPYYVAAVDKQISQKANLNKAKKLLQESGVTNPNLEIRFAQGAAAESIAQIAQQAWSQLGVDVTLTPGPQGVGDRAFFADGTDALSQSISGQADPAPMMSLYFTTPGSYKLVPSSEMVEVKAKTDAALDPSLSVAKRAENYQSVFEQAAEEMWYVPVCIGDLAWFADSNVQNLDRLPNAVSGVPDLRPVAMKKS